MPDTKDKCPKKSIIQLLEEHGIEYKLIDIEITERDLACHKAVQKFCAKIDYAHKRAAKSKLILGYHLEPAPYNSY